MTLVRKVLIVGLLLSMYGCTSGLKLSGASKGGGLYETFYTGETGLQYFIKPLEFKTAETDEYLLMDIVFRDNDFVEDSATINITLLTNEKLKVGEDLKVNTSIGASVLTYEKQIYKERAKKHYSVRISTKCTKEDAFNFMRNPISSVVHSGEGAQIDFEPTKRTTKSFQKIVDSVL